MSMVLVESEEGKKAPEQFLLQKVDLCIGQILPSSSWQNMRIV